jgi:uncharacterized membrane protein YcaP (DUF421 family)
VVIVKIVLTSLLSIAVLLIMEKLMGHKQLSELDFFDYVNGITIGSIAAELATELEEPWKPLIAIVVYGLFSVALSILTQKLPRTRKYINGAPDIIMDNGKLYRENLKKCKLDLSDFMVLCREQGYFNLDDIQTVIFEYNGKLSILPKSKSRPLKPDDLKLSPEEEKISVEVIMDGRILGENLSRMGVDEKWLIGQIKVQGYKSEKDIFLGICDKDKKLTLYPIKV